MPDYTQFGPLDSPIVSDGDNNFIGWNERIRADQLPPGFLQVSQNARIDINGEWRPRKGTVLFLSPITNVSGELVLDFYTYDDETSSTMTNSSGTVTITFGSAHNFIDQTLVYISGITGLSADVTGNHTITKVSSTEISFTVAGLTGTPGGTATVGAPATDDEAISQVYGSCAFSDPSSANDDYIILCTNIKAIAVKLSDQTTTDLDFPSGVAISGRVDMIQAFNKVFIFRDGETALEWDGNLANDFTLVANGDFTQPVTFSITVDDCGISDGVVTLTFTNTGANALAVGDIIRIRFTDRTELESLEGNTYRVATASATDVTFFADVDDFSTASTSETITFGKRVSSGTGFMHMPAPPWAVYHQKRLAMPWNYTTSGSSGSPTITDRNIRDEWVFSDILDSDTYDRIENQFRFNAGTSDYLVGALSFAEDRLLIFNRNSIHVVESTANIAEATQELISNEVGCVARKSILQVGNQVLFLSDNGVYGASFIDLYNLRGNTLPLSDPINETINRINRDYWHNATAVYFDNRYYLAVPIDGATENNALIIYNFLNGSWESLDTIFDTPEWGFQELVVAGEGSNRAVYTTSATGAIHELNKYTSSIDYIVPHTAATPRLNKVEAIAKTRMYTAGTLERKRWIDFEMSIQSDDLHTSRGSILYETENLDGAQELGSLDVFSEDNPLAAGEDYSLRGRIGSPRSYGISLEFRHESGRAKLQYVKVNGAVTFRSTMEAK